MELKVQWKSYISPPYKISFLWSVLILPPTNVQAVTSLNEDEQTMQATISWEPGHYYHHPYPNSSFYLAIRVHPDGSEATPRLEVFGRVRVKLNGKS